VFDPDRDYKHYCEFDRSKCDYATDNKGDLNQHINVHNGVRYACSKCAKTFTQKSSLSRHIRVVHEKQKLRKKIPCKRGCGKMFETNTNQSEHFDFHHDNKAWACPVLSCFYECERKCNCTAHIKRMHGGQGKPSKKDRT
jgi:uncharacterized Zn-finger protein